MYIHCLDYSKLFFLIIGSGADISDLCTLLFAVDLTCFHLDACYRVINGSSDKKEQVWLAFLYVYLLPCNGRTWICTVQIFTPDVLKIFSFLCNIEKSVCNGSGFTPDPDRTLAKNEYALLFCCVLYPDIYYISSSFRITGTSVVFCCLFCSS